MFGNRLFGFHNELLCGFPFIRILAVLAWFGGVRAVAERLNFSFCILDDAFGFSTHFICIVEELLDAHHVAMIGDSHTAHAIADSFVDEFGHRGLSVENGVLGVNVQMYEVLHFLQCVKEG